jgi:hypothetical protein
MAAERRHRDRDGRGHEPGMHQRALAANHDETDARGIATASTVRMSGAERRSSFWKENAVPNPHRKT